MSQRKQSVSAACTALFGIAALCALPAVSTATRPAAAESPLSVVLDYQETSWPVSSCSIFFTRNGASSHISKLPDMGRSSLFTGILELGRDRMALAWNKSAGKLYLDLNRNFDLTDDPGGIYSSGRNALFQNIRLTSTNDYGQYRLLIDLQLIDRGRLYARATLRSLYSGKLELTGKAWQVGLIENPFSQAHPRTEQSMLLRSWDRRADPIDNEAGAAETFALNQTVFIQERYYASRLDLRSTGENGRPVLDFTPQPGQTTQLQFRGQNVSRLILAAPGNAPAVFDHPIGSLTLPTGTYTRARVWLKRGTREAYAGFPVRIAARENPGTEFAAGGPLTNLVTVSRHGRLLRLDYRLIGIGGQTYQLLHQNRSRPPEFAIYKDGNRLATGKFTYG